MLLLQQVSQHSVCYRQITCFICNRIFQFSYFAFRQPVSLNYDFVPLPKAEEVSDWIELKRNFSSRFMAATSALHKIIIYNINFIFYFRMLLVRSRPSFATWDDDARVCGFLLREWGRVTISKQTYQSLIDKTWICYYLKWDKKQYKNNKII